MKNRTKTLAWLALLTVVITWGLSPVIGKYMLNSYSPGAVYSIPLKGCEGFPTDYGIFMRHGHGNYVTINGSVRAYTQLRDIREDEVFWPRQNYVNQKWAHF